MEDLNGKPNFGEGMKGIYAYGDHYQILAQDGEYTQMAVNEYGHGRGVYLAGLPYSPENCRLLLRSIYYAAHREADMKEYYVTNCNTEIAAYESAGVAAVINNTSETEKTDVVLHGSFRETLELKPGEMRWISIR